MYMGSIYSNNIRYVSNAIHLLDDYGKQYATGIYTYFSLINNNCRPSCFVVFSDRYLSVKVVEDIKIGQEVSISYFNEMNSERYKW